MLGAQTERVQIVKCCEVRCVTVSILYLLLLFGGRHNYNKKPCGFIDVPFIPQDTQSKKVEYIKSA